jgi:hypothetical protein
MLEINFKIKENGFFTTNSESVLVNILSRYNLKDIPFGYIFLGYPDWHQPNIDLFQYLDEEFLNNLRNKNTVLIVDHTFEGFSSIECPIVDILEKNCDLYKINPQKIFYFTGNLRISSKRINALPIFLLDNANNFKFLNTNLEQIQKNFHSKKTHEIVLSLSRRNRHHRVMAHAMLFHSEIKNYSVISQDKLDNFHLHNSTLTKMGINEKSWKKFIKNLPLLADKNEFEINDPFNPLTDLHNKTCFSIVNETLINDYNGSSLFFSEKILKPIINFQPMIIYGQPGINHALEELGFKTYKDYFDLSFDFEQDNVLRYKKLLNTIDSVVKSLAAMTVEQQAEWRFKHLEILNHNFQNFRSQTHSNSISEKFIKIVSQL